MTNRRFAALFGKPPRDPESDLDQHYINVARSIQDVTEEIMLRLGRTVHREVGADHLCLAGGVALNCVANVWQRVSWSGKWRTWSLRAMSSGSSRDAWSLGHERWVAVDRRRPARPSHAISHEPQDQVSGVVPSVRPCRQGGMRGAVVRARSGEPIHVAGCAGALSGLERLHEQRSDIPAVTHVDYSARIQTVHRETNPRFHALLDAFEHETGCPVLINTSFNVRGEPIVESRADAYRRFLRTEMDYLVMEDAVLDTGWVMRLLRVRPMPLAFDPRVASYRTTCRPRDARHMQRPY